ncbi:MAG TPA: sialate O-acetylesterase [Trueperaceae bacterium]
MNISHEQSAPRLLRWCSVLLLLAFSACSGGVSPQIVEFTAEPTSVVAGETVRLHWKVEGLDEGRLRLEALPEGAVEPTSLGDVTAQSSTVLEVEATTTFRLVAVGPRGTASKETTVEVVLNPPPPPEIGYFRSADSDEGAVLEWKVTGAEDITIEPLGIDVEAEGRLVVHPCGKTDYTLVASNAGGSVSESLTIEVGESDCLLFLVAGQSNASGYGKEVGGRFPVDGLTEEPQEGVMMFDPEQGWVLASEPTHEGARHSFLVRFGKEVRERTGGKRVFLVPTAVGGSPLDDWQPGAELFEEAMELTQRATDSLGVPVEAVLWFQGESDTSNESERSRFVDRTDDTLSAFHERLPGRPPVIFVQLSKRLWSEQLDEPGDNIQGHNLAYQYVREQQRLMESGANQAVIGPAAESGIDRSYYYMAVSHDLPMSDAKHISAHGQRVLGTRLARLYMACVAQECGSPPGPRLEEIRLQTTAAGSAIVIDLSEPVTPPSDPPYDNYFAVFIDGVEQTGFTIERGSVDQSLIRLQFSTSFAGEAQVEVRYMPPENMPPEQDLYVASENVVMDLDDGLPLPAFGLPVEDLPCDDPSDECDSIPGLRMQ